MRIRPHSDLSERVHLKGCVLISDVSIVNGLKVPHLKHMHTTVMHTSELYMYVSGGSLAALMAGAHPDIAVHSGRNQFPLIQKQILYNALGEAGEGEVCLGLWVSVGVPEGLT